MLSENYFKSLKQSLILKHEKHINILISNPSILLDQIIPNREIPISEILQKYNEDVGAELVRYGEELKDEIIRILSSFNDLIFSEEDKFQVLSLVENYCNPELYISRFQRMLDAIDRKMGKYGLKFDQQKYRIDLPKSLCEVGAINTTRRIKQEIENELNILVQNSKNRMEDNQSTGLKVTGKNNVFINCAVNGFDKGIELGETAEGNAFIKTDTTAPNKRHSYRQKRWYEKPSGIVILGILASLIASTIWCYLSIHSPITSESVTTSSQMASPNIIKNEVTIDISGNNNLIDLVFSATVRINLPTDISSDWHKLPIYLNNKGIVLLDITGDSNTIRIAKDLRGIIRIDDAGENNTISYY